THNLSNLKLLCFSCHRRESIKYFGAPHVLSYGSRKTPIEANATFAAKVPVDIELELAEACRLSRFAFREESY
ncbi:MAG: hypothetical protein HQK52_22065, partial [Oligoflexia bacterium]|nr:hypothetical protein [Oligoflexia bacterium]